MKYRRKSHDNRGKSRATLSPKYTNNNKKVRLQEKKIVVIIVRIEMIV